MNILKGLDAIDFAVKNDADFIAYAVSPWHILGIRAVLNKLNREGKTLKGIILICKDSSGMYSLRVEDCSDILNVQAFLYHSDIELAKLFQTLCNPITENISMVTNKYVIFPYRMDSILYSYYQKRVGNPYINCYVIDEGVGSYLGIRIPYSYVEIFRLSFWSKKLKGAVRTVLERIIQYKLKSLNLFYDFKLLKKNDGKWFRNDEVVPYYQDVIYNKNEDEKEINRWYSGAVLINTLPFEKGELQKENVDFDVLQIFCKKCNEKGIKLVIKLHPIEQNVKKYKELEKYAFFDSRKGIAQEKLLGSMHEKPIAVVSFYSSTLLTAKLLFDIPTFSLNKCLPCDSISPFFKKKAEDFEERFDNLICFNDSMDSIVDEIVRLI